MGCKGGLRLGKGALVLFVLAVFAVGASDRTSARPYYEPLWSEAETFTEEHGGPDEVEVGMFVSSIYDLDFYDGTFKTIFWVWFIFDDPAYNPLDAIEVTNARSYEVLESYGHGRDDGREYIAAKMQVTINQPWDVSDFPFDNQRLEIILESVGKDATQLVFNVDDENSIISRDLWLSGWTTLPIESSHAIYQYNSTFGEESTEAISFPRLVFAIPMERNNPKLFFEAYIGYLIAFLMCGAIWITIPFGMADYRIGMTLASLFAAIGNKNVLESNYPPSPTIGLSDQIEVITFLLITVSLFLSVGCERLHISGYQKIAHRLNLYGFPAMLLLYIGLLSFFVLQAAKL